MCTALSCFPLFSIPPFHSLRRTAILSEGNPDVFPQRAQWLWAATSSLLLHAVCCTVWSCFPSLPPSLCWSLFIAVLAEVSTSKHLQMQLNLKEISPLIHCSSLCGSITMGFLHQGFSHCGLRTFWGLWVDTKNASTQWGYIKVINSVGYF